MVGSKEKDPSELRVRPSTEELLPEASTMRKEREPEASTSEAVSCPVRGEATVRFHLLGTVVDAIFLLTNIV